MPKESEKDTITSFSGTPLVRVVDGLNSRNISPANLVAETGAQAALDARYLLGSGMQKYAGVPIFGYGHSWMAGNATPYYRKKWLDRIVKPLGTETPSNQGYSGHMAYQSWYEMFTGPNKTPWTQDTTGMVFLQVMLNDYRHQGTDAGSIGAWKKTVEAMIRLARAEVYQPDQTQASFTGPWTATNNAVNFRAGTGLAFTSTVGHYADFTVSGDEVTILTHKLRASSAGGAFVVKEGATVLGTFDCGGDVGLAAAASHPNGYTPSCLHISGMGAGSHNLRLECTEAGSIYFDGWLAPMAAPPTVALIADPTLDDYTGGSPFNNGSDAARAAYKTGLDELAAMFSNNEVVVIDLDGSDWDPATMIGADTVHPNDLGSAVIAEKVIAALNALPYRNGLQLLETA